MKNASPEKEAILIKGGLPLTLKPKLHQCPWCLRPVGLLGRGFAAVLGTGIHSCDFSNVMSPREAFASLASPQQGR